jgi:hypothetical protein
MLWLSFSYSVSWDLLFWKSFFLLFHIWSLIHYSLKCSWWWQVWKLCIENKNYFIKFLACFVSSYFLFILWQVGLRSRVFCFVINNQQYWIFYRGSDFLSVVWFSFTLTLFGFPPLTFLFIQTFCVLLVLFPERKGEERGRLGWWRVK